MDGEADHVHLLVDASPNVQPSRLVNTLKTISSRELRKEFAEELARHYWRPVLWSRAYCILSAGGAALDVIRKYIQNQGKDTD
jgi:putative transposase